MKKTLLLSLFFATFFGFSQVPTAKIQNYLDQNKAKFGLTSQDVNDWFVDGTTSSTSTNIENYYIKQRVQGIEVYNTNSNVWYKNGNVIEFINSFVANANQKTNTLTPSINVLEGLSKAFIDVNEISANNTILETRENNLYVISNGDLSENPINAKLVFQANDDQSSLKLAWDFTFYTQDFQHLWSIRVDAVNGKVLEKFDGVLSCTFGDSNHKNHNHNNFFFTKKGFKVDNPIPANMLAGSYTVVPFEIESPNHGSFQTITNPENALASPYGWHDTNGVAGAEYTYTRGNNVLAQEDANGNNGNGARPDGGAGLAFNYTYGGPGVVANTYVNAATTNLFYMNNAMHDVYYNYGFNEANGNFQANNYGRGGAQGDYVLADSQDGSGTNNANFSTPADGTSPRMQMFLWDVAPPNELLTVNSPAIIAGNYYAQENVFDPGHVPLPPSPGITSNLVLYLDPVGGTNEACGTAAPLNGAAMNGNIVVIRRGNCTFVEKVKNAQNRGATAVIVVNNVAGALVNMSGADFGVTIPAVFVTKEVGDALIAQMSTSTVNATLKHDPAPTFVNTDGDFDNGVIAHEYGHGISTRLTGGPFTSCLNNAEQMGEGWSDFFALMLQMKAGDNPNARRGIGTFVMSQATSDVGIRTYPYSRDMTVNPFTFASSNTEVVPHGVGSVWATMLWDLAWAYVDKYGFDPNKYTGTGGNNKVMRLVLDGLKLQGCNPTFVTARNALISADQATTGGQDYCLIWEVFARRGLGFGASSGSATSATDQVESFVVPPPGPNCTLSANYFENEDMIKVYPNPSNGMINIAINNYSGELNIQIFDLNGRKVYNQNVNDFNLEKALDLNSLQKGIYLLKMNGQDLSFTKKIILN